MRFHEKVRLIRQELTAFKQVISFDTSLFPADVQAALDYLHQHLFEERLNVSELYQQCNLRSHNLSGRFKRTVGLGIRDYIEDKRMMAAMRLLWQEELEVYLIAASVGFTHHESFTRAFKRCIGRTPSEFRARCHALGTHRARSRESVKRNRRWASQPCA